MINAQEFFTHALANDGDVDHFVAFTKDYAGNKMPNIFEYPCEEELSDNPEKPYIVVQNTGTTSKSIDKDMDSFDPMHDTTTIEAVCVTSNKDDAKTLAKIVRKAIAIRMDNFSQADVEIFGFCLEDSTYSDNGVQFDVESGNYFVTLKYQIETSK